uniref:NADH dehydrogenase subunit 2 n=1 Tax=Melampus sincaporensis TaxID=1628046 RepID=UPI0030024154|nr:NADH dehydrogenase subunit 2 [Melampus sincaporensis]
MPVTSLLFTSMLVFGPVLSLSSSSWVFCWAGMEIGLLGLIPLLLSGKMASNKEAALKYFCLQALASVFLFISGMYLFSSLHVGNISTMTMLLALSLKLGLFPGHFWVPSVSLGVDWISCFLVLGPLKLPPFGFLAAISSLSLMASSMILILGGLSALMGALIGLNQSKVRGMLGASSIAHTGWASIGAVSGAMWFYIVVYLGVLFVTLGLLWMNQTGMSGMFILSMSGLPPFIMFPAKLSVLSGLVAANTQSFIFLMLPLLGAIISLVFYLKFFYSFTLSESRPGMSSSLLGVGGFNLLGAILILLFFGGRGEGCS